MDYGKMLRLARVIMGGDIDRINANNHGFSLFLAGLGAGVALGVLFAPQAGRDTREFIGKKTKEGLDQATAKSKEWGKRAQEVVNEGKRQVSKAVESGKQAYYEEKGQQTGQNY